jgi:hypothetical protein
MRMKLRTRWPWITALLAAAVVLNPIGLDIFYSAFLSGEQLSRNIWGSIVWTGIALLALIVLLEWLFRTLILKRSTRNTTTA